MKYEFHVGDYVETVGGFIGWISYVDRNYITIKSHDNIISGPWLLPDEQYHFNRIGQYDFTQQDQKIEKMQITFTSSDYNDDGWHIKSILELRQKVNELVEAVNKMQNKGCSGCLHLEDKKYKCESCVRFGHVDRYISND